MSSGRPAGVPRPGPRGTATVVSVGRQPSWEQLPRERTGNRGPSPWSARAFFRDLVPGGDLTARAVPGVGLPVPEPDVGEPPRDGLAGRWRWGPLFASIWLIYLAGAFQAAWRYPGIALRALALVAIVGFSVLYVSSWFWMRRWRRRNGAVPVRATLGIVGTGALLFLAATPAAGQSALAMLIFLTVLIMFTLPPRSALAGVALTAGFVEIASRTVPGWHPMDQLGFQVVVTAIAMYGVGQLVVRNQELATAQQELARLAVTQERSRFARDLHDILGHSLTVVTVKAELAGRLVHVDPQRAEREIGEVERLAREALTDVRSAVAGYRETSLAGELVSARIALDAAGIEAELPNAVDDVPGERRDLVGWTLREAVTNVVRHSGATRCRVRVDAHGIEVSDDGRGPAADAGSGGAGSGGSGSGGSGSGGSGSGGSGSGGAGSGGHGLLGLRERSHRAGAALTVGRSQEGGFLLRVTW
jgi:two-component system sensor histidine kinase DesK